MITQTRTSSMCLSSTINGTGHALLTMRQCFSIMSPSIQHNYAALRASVATADAGRCGVRKASLQLTLEGVGCVKRRYSWRWMV